MKPLALISGTGLEDFPLMQGARPEPVSTPYGVATVYRRQHQGRELLFLPRHQKNHSLPPHAINYRANLCALALCGAREVLALCCVGSLRREWQPGSLVLCGQFIDMTWGRESSFCREGAVDHADMSQPYCGRLSAQVAAAGARAGLAMQRDAVYICTQGPRLETAAEIAAYRTWGADIVGMTGVPEAPLAREAGLCYASLAMVVNYAAGMDKSVEMAEIYRMMALHQQDLHRLLEAYLESAPPSVDCGCAAARVKACTAWLDGQ